MSSFVKNLARAVEKHPVLYNQASQTDAKKDDYEEAWQAVSFECDKPVAVIKTRWSKTIKSLIQHLANPPPKTQARKTRSSDFQLIDELKFMVPFVGSESPNCWETAMNDSDAADAKSAASPAPTSGAALSKPKTERQSSTDSCNELGDPTQKAAKNVTVLSTARLVVNDKRKREISKSLMHKVPSAENASAAEGRKTEAGLYFVAEPAGNSSSSVRYRRIVEDPAQLKSRDKHKSSPAEAKPFKAEMQQSEKLVAINKLLRKRSSSMYMDHKQQSGDDSDDVEYQPPTAKKLAASNTAAGSPRTRATKARVSAVGLKRIVNAAIRSPAASSTSATSTTAQSNARSSVASVECSPDSHDSSNEYGGGVDMSMIEAAAAAAAKAALEERATDAGTQCNYEADEEDDEFLERTRLWLQRMNPRQKLVFRKGVYQAFLDVYDDPRNFEIQKGADKFVITQLNGMPALFTGMTPIELRLVRQLAIAVAGSKLSAPVVGPKFGGGPEAKCKSPSIMQLAANAANRTSHKQPQQFGASSPSPPSHLRSAPSEKPPAVLRTTAIALSNQARTPSGMQRVLRKVVRVDNSALGGGVDGAASGNGGGGSSGGGGNVSLARPRTVSVSTNNSSNPQRIYRILPNGNIMRHSPIGGGSNSSNSQSVAFSQPASAAGANSQPLSSNNRLPTTSTLTTSTGTVITTRNISKPTQLTSHTQMLVDPKTGIRRQYVTTANGAATAVDSGPKKIGRPPMSRRYSICSIPRESAAPEPADSMRWSTGGALGPPQQSKPAPPTAASSAAAAAAAAAGAPKPIVRVRFAQNQTNSPAAAANAARSQFALPAAVSPRKQQPSSPLPSDAPIPISISSSNNIDNSDEILIRAQQVYENAVLVGERAVQGKATAAAGGVAGRRSAQSCAQEDKTNCLITSDRIENFVVKNEPFDQDEEEINADFMN